MQGHAGDTLASALLANGVRLIGRSFKYHRPRGILTAGSEEPNALVQLRSGARQGAQHPRHHGRAFRRLDRDQPEPPRVARIRPDGGQRPAVALPDGGLLLQDLHVARAFWEKLYEPVIRASAGLGRLSMQEDPDRYDKGFLHCDLLVIGAGPAGSDAALAAGRAGARVILADEDFRPGGRLNAETLRIDDMAGADWAAAGVAELAPWTTCA